MIRKSYSPQLLAGLLAASGAISSSTFAALIEDSKASLELRNMYLNRDYREPGTATSYGEVWAQGFIARFESGYTEGTVGFGADLTGMLGLRLDSGKGRVNGASGGGGIGMLPLESDGSPVDDYSELGVTAKARISKSTLHLGTLQPVLPVVQYNNTRLLPGNYSGAMITSQEIDGLTLHAARLTEYNLRDQSHRQDFPNDIDNFDLLGGSYTFNPQLTASYYYGRYDNTYKQHFAGLVHTLPLGEGLSLRSDLRYFQTDYDASGVGNNRFLNGMFTLSAGAHKFAAGFQNMSGDSVLGVITGSDPYSTNLSTYWTFNRQNEDAWQLRYDYDFAGLGIPGLTFMSRYISGYNIESTAGNDGKEWERNSDLIYTFQNSTLKGLRVHLRNVTYRANQVTGPGAIDIDENRVIVSYTLPLL
ncbi:OprD family porin [Pseudomonas sp. GD03721]|nr:MULTISPECIES: OprD family porin [unclassified Pseudomonas]MDH1443246.1 OprD family porin [Pseudomonas sp. GD03722]WGG00703.1 OprD family porin [Pseudomonas sp. GD03721]WGG04869.1 OprD family porin [Pseudomonas sp. GD03919]